LNAADPHSLKGAWFQPLNLSSVMKLVSKFAAFKCNLYRYGTGAGALTAMEDAADLRNALGAALKSGGKVALTPGC
jgi:hypothetical protein